MVGIWPQVTCVGRGPGLLNSLTLIVVFVDVRRRSRGVGFFVRACDDGRDCSVRPNIPGY